MAGGPIFSVPVDKIYWSGSWVQMLMPFLLRDLQIWGKFKKVTYRYAGA